MPRPKGSQNKPLTAAELMAKLKAEYAAKGVDIRFTTHAGKAVEGKAEGDEVAMPDDFDVNVFEVTGVEDGDDEDVYKCGACNQVLDSPHDKCPFCGAGLSW